MTERNDNLPPHAKLAFKGKIFEVWQWEQKMYDGSIAIFERLKRPDTVEIIATVGDKIIIQKQEQPDRPAPFLSLPGGLADGGGSPLEEAMRELREETEYVSDDWQRWRAITPSHRIIYTKHYFIAKNCRYQSELNLDPGEKIKNELVTFDEFLMLSENPSFRGSDFVKLLLQLRLNTEARKEFYQLLFS